MSKKVLTPLIRVRNLVVVLRLKHQKIRVKEQGPMYKDAYSNLNVGSDPHYLCSPMKIYIGLSRKHPEWLHTRP